MALRLLGAAFNGKRRIVCCEMPHSRDRLIWALVLSFHEPFGCLLRGPAPGDRGHAPHKVSAAGSGAGSPLFSGAPSRHRPKLVVFAGCLGQVVSGQGCQPAP